MMEVVRVDYCTITIDRLININTKFEQIKAASYMTLIHHVLDKESTQFVNKELKTETCNLG